MGLADPRGNAIGHTSLGITINVQLGACCVEGVCTDNLLASQCTDKFFKDQPCSDPIVSDVCEKKIIVPALTELGLLVMTLLLLVGVLIKFGRRREARI